MRLHPLTAVDRRLLPADARILGQTPLHAVVLPYGSYLLQLVKEGHAPVNYPVSIGRLVHWHGVPTGDPTPRPVLLPTVQMLGPDDVYVPAGFCQIGGDEAATRPLPASEAWVDGFVIDRHPVTNRGWLEFLTALVLDGRSELAAACEPRVRSARAGVLGTPIYGRRGDGSYRLLADAEGDVWDPEWPVMMIPWTAARSYAA